MTCSEALKYLSLYLDSELDPKTSFEIARHLEQCPACAGRFAHERRLEGRLAASVRGGEPDPALWDQALVAVVGASGRRRGWGRLAAWAAVVLLALGAAFAVLRRAAPPELVLTLIQDHQKLVGGAEKVELATSDAGAIGAFFKDRLPVDVRCPARDFVPSGARNCYLRRRLVAYVQGRTSDQAVSLFFIPASALEVFPEMAATFRDDGPVYFVPVGRYGVAARLRGEALICAVGELPPDRLRSLVE